MAPAWSPSWSRYPLWSAARSRCGRRAWVLAGRRVRIARGSRTIHRGRPIHAFSNRHAVNHPKPADINHHPSTARKYRHRLHTPTSQYLNKYMHAHRNAAMPARRCARAPVWQGASPPSHHGRPGRRGGRDAAAGRPPGGIVWARPPGRRVANTSPGDRAALGTDYSPPWRPLVCGRVNGTKDDIPSQTWHVESGRPTTTGTCRAQLRPEQRETNAPAAAPAAGEANERNHRYDEHSECQP